VKTVLLSAAVSMIIALFGTPLAIKAFTQRGYGQEIRSDGPAGHLSKRGTPTMGGTVIIIASLGGYLVGHLVTGDPMSASGLLVLFLMTGLGLVGFADDFIKLYMQRSLGLRSGAKLAGQAVVGGVFALLAIRFPDGYDLTPASTHLSFLADFWVSIGPVFFVVWVIIMVAGTSNGVNLTDGLDGLATGTAILVFAAYMIIGIWQLRNDCTVAIATACYDVRDPQDIAVVAATVMGACAGFLWWNAPPAKIFMGDTGSLALGGALAGLAITTRTELLLLLLGGLFVIITLSVVIQVGSYKMTGKRVFRMAPLQHHFELAGWAETTIVVRFWIIAGICVALGLGIFYVGLDPNHPSKPPYHPSPKHPAPAPIHSHAAPAPAARWSSCAFTPRRAGGKCTRSASARLAMAKWTFFGPGPVMVAAAAAQAKALSGSSRGAPVSRLARVDIV